MILGASNLMNTLRRVGLWFGSLLLSVALFSLFSNLLFSGPGFFRVGTVLLIFRVTMIFALPAWCICLRFVIALKDAEGRRIWTIFLSGILIGPASLALWGLILLARGDDPHEVWEGDPLVGLGAVEMMTHALIVGFLTTSFYVIALKVLHHRSTAAKSRFNWT